MAFKNINDVFEALGMTCSRCGAVKVSGTVRREPHETLTYSSCPNCDPPLADGELPPHEWVRIVRDDRMVAVLRNRGIYREESE